jgi:hypothetical protein
MEKTIAAAAARATLDIFREFIRDSPRTLGTLIDIDKTACIAPGDPQARGAELYAFGHRAVAKVTRAQSVQCLDRHAPGYIAAISHAALKTAGPDRKSGSHGGADRPKSATIGGSRARASPVLCTSIATLTVKE